MDFPPKTAKKEDEELKIPSAVEEQHNTPPFDTTQRVNTGPTVKFKELCEDVFNALEKVPKRGMYAGYRITDEKAKIFAHFYQRWRNDVGNDIYPALVLILPMKRPKAYDAGEYKATTYVLELLKIPRKSRTWNETVEWKKVAKPESGRRLSHVLTDLIASRREPIKGGMLSIEDVNVLLDTFAQEKKEGKMEALKTFIDNMCDLELRYIFDIILKKNIIGNMENVALAQWHPDAPKYFNVDMDLRRVTQILWNPEMKLHDNDLKVKVGQPFLPMLSLRPLQTIAKIHEYLGGGEIWIEEKLDGERIQMHWSKFGKEVKFFSRKGVDYTYLYGTDKDADTVARHIQFVDRVEDCILDGELLVLDPVDNELLPFGTLKGTVERMLAHKAEYKSMDPNACRVLFIVFDVVYLNQRSLTDWKLRTRRDILRKILIEKKGYVEVIQENVTKRTESINDIMTTVIRKGGEGIVLKNPNSKYGVDKRGKDWIKLKPEYLTDLGDNVDLCVIGRDMSHKNTYMCGLRNSANDVGDFKVPEFWSFCRIANGFNSETTRQLENMTRGKWRRYDPNNPPNLVVFGSKVPYEVIDPEDSVVIEVKARKIDNRATSSFRVGTTLYNAYCRSVRLDKTWKDAATMDEYTDAKLRAEESAHNQDVMRRKKRRIRSKRQREEEGEEQWNTEVGAESKLFDGLTFKIASDAFHNGKRVSKREMETIVERHGGRVVENLEVNDLLSFRVISHKNTVDATTLVEKNYDILKPSWVFDCIETGRVLKVTVPHIYMSSPSLLEKAKGRSDALGHNYAVPLTEERLAMLFRDGLTLTDLDKVEILPELNGLKLFGFSNVYLIHDGDKDGYDYRFIRMRLEAYGAKITEDLNAATLAVAVSNEPSVIQRVRVVREQLASIVQITDEGMLRTIRIVKAGWVLKSIEEGEQADPQDYLFGVSRDME